MFHSLTTRWSAFGSDVWWPLLPWVTSNSCAAPSKDSCPSCSLGSHLKSSFPLQHKKHSRNKCPGQFPFNDLITEMLGMLPSTCCSYKGLLVYFRTHTIKGVIYFFNCLMKHLMICNWRHINLSVRKVTKNRTKNEISRWCHLFMLASTPLTSERLDVI